MSSNHLMQRFALNGKIALITGASSGLGEHFAQTLADAGAKVVVTARRVDRLHRLVERIRSSGGQAIALPIDVADAKSVADCFEQTI